MKNELDLEILESFVPEHIIELDRKDYINKVFLVFRLIKVNIKDFKKENNFIESLILSDKEKLFKNDFIIEAEIKDMYFYIENKNQLLNIKLKLNSKTLEIKDMLNLKKIEQIRTLDILRNFINKFIKEKRGY